MIPIFTVTPQPDGSPDPWEIECDSCELSIGADDQTLPMLLRVHVGSHLHGGRS